MQRKITKFFAPKPKTKVDINEEQPQIRDCKVVLKDIKYRIKNRQIETAKNVPQKLPKICGEIFECSICGMKTHHEGNLTKHMTYKHLDKVNNSQPCPFCPQKFTLKTKLENHIKNDHFFRNSAINECDFCGKIFKTKSQLGIHLKTHLPTVKCDICQAEVKQSYIRYHMIDFHESRASSSCKICSKSFHAKRNMQKHMLIHDKKFECQICSQKFTIKHRLLRHHRERHETVGKFGCDCGKKFNHEKALKQHEKTHDRNRPKPLKCQKCNYSSEFKRNFEKHQKAHAKEEAKFAAMKNPVQCEICGKLSRNKSTLKSHMKCVHTTTLFQCDLCGSYSKRKSHVVRHMTLHQRNFK